MTPMTNPTIFNDVETQCQAIKYNDGVCAVDCKCPVRRVRTYDVDRANSYESMGQAVNPNTPPDEIIGGVWFRGVKKGEVYAALRRMRTEIRTS